MGFESMPQRRIEKKEEPLNEVIPSQEIPPRRELPSNVIEGPWQKIEPEPVQEEVVAETHPEIPMAPEFPEQVPEEVIEDDSVRQDANEPAPIDEAEKLETGGTEGGGEEEETKRHRYSEGYGEYEICKTCKGRGRRWLVFACPTCGGLGSVLKKYTSKSGYYETTKPTNTESAPTQDQESTQKTE